MKSIRFFLLSILLMDLSVAFAAITWTGSSSAWTKGTGTQSNPYLIETPEQLAYLSEIVNAGVNLYDGIYFKQTADFNMNNLPWTPIGSSLTNNFLGNYDGNEKSITNLKPSGDCIGLFGYAKNSEFSGIIIKGKITSTSYNVSYAASILAYGQYVSFINCTNEASIDKIAVKCGGIAAYIKGGAYDDDNTFTNCINTGNITAIGCAGGLVGACSYSTFTNCSNSGTISSQTTYSDDSRSIAGGLVGDFDGRGRINECFNLGTVISTYSGYESQVLAGGMVGETTSSIIVVKNCYVRANVTAGGWQDKNEYAYGLADGGTFTNCYFVGSIEGTTTVPLGSINMTMTNCYYDSNVYGSTSATGAKTTTLMKSASMPTILNGTSDNCWMSDVDNINNGYPILKFQRTTATISVETSSTGQVQGGGTFSIGSSVILTAIPNEGYIFSHWSDGNTDNPRTITVTEDAQYTAFFIPEGIENKFIFVSLQDGSTVGLISLSSHQTLEYSTDEITWNNMTTSTTISLNKGDYIYLRGVLSGNNSTSDYTQFEMTGSIAAKGNTNVLWNYENPESSLKAYCGFKLFYQCVALATAPELPATTLAQTCYAHMFRRCTNLASPPSLPATILAKDCYNAMFFDCTNLATAPQLSATTLADGCYASMLRNTGLKKAPLLPALTLSPSCYMYMFRDCVGLTEVPELPAETLQESCYKEMFYGCSSLSYIKCLATDISATSCSSQWVSGVATSGTFVKNSAMTSWTTGENGIPAGWTRRDTIIPNKYIVTFVDWDGTILKTEQVDEGKSATAPADPSRDGYTFIGWDEDFSFVTSNITITAQYEEGVPYNYNLLFTNGTDNSEIAIKSISINLPVPPTITNFTFLKWQIVGGDLEDTIEIRAIYIADSPTNTQPVVENPKNSAQKLIRQGNVYVLTGDKTYTIIGAAVK